MTETFDFVFSDGFRGDGLIYNGLSYVSAKKHEKKINLNFSGSEWVIKNMLQSMKQKIFYQK